MTRGSVHESSFLVFPSEFESFGLVAAKAMAKGLPVVIMNLTGPSDYFTPKNSVPVDPHEIKPGLMDMIVSLNHFQPHEIRDGIMEGFENWSVPRMC